MTLVKTGTAVLMVVLLSVLAEVVSPRFAGVLSGYPLGAALSLFFMGFEISPRFAAQGALYTSVGVVATQAFAYCYFRASLAAWKLHAGLHILLASLAGVAGYFAAAAVLRFLPTTRVTAILLPAFFMFVFIYLFRGVRNVRIQKRVSMSPKVLAFRSAFAACAIVLITSTAGMVGPGWAGLFAAFPMTMLPFVVIIHFTYGPEYAHAILKNVPKGLGSLAVYGVGVSVCYPAYGIYAGTAIAYGLATVYLIAAQLKINLPGRR